jgi:hypothetical protein
MEAEMNKTIYIAFAAIALLLVIQCPCWLGTGDISEEVYG